MKKFQGRRVHIFDGCFLARAIPCLMVSLWCAWSLSACKKTGAGSEVALRVPSALAVAGNLVFVANAGEDTVQVVQLTDDVSTFSFVPSPTIFFPLRIPAGPLPNALATLPMPSDGNAHALVAVLSRAEGSLRIIDADPNVLALSADATRTDAVTAAVLSVGGVDAVPMAMVASPVSCATPQTPACRGHVYVALSALGQIAEVEISGGMATEANQYKHAVRMRLTAVYDVGGTPTRLAMHPSGAMLYITDADAPELLQLAITTTPSAVAGTLVRQDVGASGGPVAVSQDGNYVLVGRTAFNDVVIFDVSDPAHGITQVAANGRASPTPRCLRACGAADPSAPAVCTDTFPTDTTLCVAPNGYEVAPGTVPYRALYLDLSPAVIATFGASAAGAPVSVRMPAMAAACAPTTIASDGTVTTSTTVRVDRSYAQFAAVMGLDGSMQFIGLPSSAATASDTAITEPEVMSSMHCQTPTLTRVTEKADGIAVDDAVALKDFLAPCPAHPADTARIACLQTDDGLAGVLAWSGQSLDRHWLLAWEGVLVDRSVGGGQLNAGGELIDSGADLQGSGVRVGDWVEIVTNPVATAPASCPSELCGRNRKITAVGTDGAGRSRLVMADPIDPACFGTGSPIVQYTVRVGETFATTSPTGAVVRLAPGASYGPGRAVGDGQRIAFALQPLGDTLTAESLAALSACERYESDGRPKAGMLPFMSRKAPVGFKLMDPFKAITSGIQFDAQGAGSGNVGHLPTAMVVASRSGGAQPVAFVTYGATNALLAFVPFDSANLFGPSQYRVFR